MELNKRERRYYRLDVVTIPAITSLEGSFDDGLTWQQGEVVAGGFQWLLAGPNFSGTAAAGQINILAPTLVPLIRITAAPEFEIRNAPPVTLVG